MFKKHSAASFRARQSQSRYAQLHDPVQPFYGSILKARKYKKYTHVLRVFCIFPPVLSQPTNHNPQITTHKSQLTNHKSQLTNHNSQITTHHSQPTKKAVNPAGSQSRFFTFPAKIFQNQAKKRCRKQLFRLKSSLKNEFIRQIDN